jgi:hypothetical protein
VGEADGFGDVFGDDRPDVAALLEFSDGAHAASSSVAWLVWASGTMTYDWERIRAGV